MHLEIDEENSYFTKTKYMNDYSMVFTEELEKLEGDESEAAKLKKLNIKGRFNHENYEANKRFSSIEAFQEQVDSGIQLWDIAAIRDKYTEDNDTDDEQSSEEEDDGTEQQKLLRMMDQLLQNRKANINDLNKGFVFFMDQEKAQIKKLRNEQKKK